MGPKDIPNPYDRDVRNSRRWMYFGYTLAVVCFAMLALSVLI